MKRNSLIFIFLFLMQMGFVLALQPFGANITQISSERATVDPAGSIPAQAGNVTQINIFGYSPTQTWQGYFGNISGTIMLADSNDNVMYNWSLASPQGEIYASTNGNLDWTNVQCFNFTADGTFEDDSANRGETSQFGMNLTQLEAAFNIKPDDVDGVDETFTLQGPGTHSLFYTNNLEFSEGQCMSTRLFSNAGIGESGKFEEALLYEPTSQSVIFTSIINEDVLGFDNRTHDFQMIVLEDGHGTNTETTTYYFYVELE